MSDDEDSGVREWLYRWGAKIRTPVDIPDEMSKDAVEQSRKAVEELLESGATWEEGGLDVVKKVKMFFDEKYGPAWHCVIGKNFGCHATHDVRKFIYFYFSDDSFFDRAVMLFKAGP